VTDLYAVIGNPIAHSKSPIIHSMFANQTNQDLMYMALFSETAGFKNTVNKFIKRKGLGLNVTLPFKQEAFLLANSLGNHARITGAVNTLIINSNGEVRGENTDGIGLMRDLKENLKICVSSCRVLILGAGGAVRGILPSIIDEKPESITLANRTETKTHELVDLFAELYPISPFHFNQLSDQKYDLIINGTSASVDNQLPPIPDGILENKGFCYDLMYSNEPTPFVTWGLKQGASVSADGLGMLVEQAAQSFYLWRDTRPETSIIIETLKQKT